MFEIIGLVGTAFTVFSLVQTDMKKLRIINSVGSVLFIIYALLIHSPSVLVSNWCIFVINMWRLRNDSNN